MIESLDIKLVLVRKLLVSGALETAAQEINQLVAAWPDSGKVQYLNGLIQFRYLGNSEAAEEAFRKAMRNDGSEPHLYTDYGELLLQTGKYTELVAVLNRALEVPLIERDKIFALFGSLYERQQNWDEALEYYSRAALFTLDTLLMEKYLADRSRVIRKKTL